MTILDLRNLSAFSQYFVLCSGTSSPQLEAISDSIEERLHQHGIRPQHREGRPGAEWVLLDYGRLVVHIFSERARLYYDLERLWRAAPRTDLSSPDDAVPDATARGGPLPAASEPDTGTTRP